MKNKRYYIIRSFTLIGNLFPQFLVLCFLSFFIDFEKGAYLTSVWFFGYATNLLLKNIIKKPRPDKENAKVNVKGYSLPSGHAFMSTVFFYSMAYFFDFSLPILIIFLIMPILLGLSRLYLKVHDIWDIVSAWCFAGLYLYFVSPLTFKVCKNVLFLLSKLKNIYISNL